jgi:hypothetical protein
MGFAYLAALLSLCGASIVLGLRYRKFAFVTYGILYGYGAISFKLLEVLGGPTEIFFYGVTTGTVVLIALVVLARRFGRDE